jgi:hypothetical protein
MLPAGPRLWRAIVTALVPEAAGLDPDAWAELDAIVARALAARPRQLRRQLALFVRCVGWLPVLRYGRRFVALDPARRVRVLAALQTAPLLLVRRGVWGLRTLVFLGYYGRPAARAAVGYRADPRGWEARR